MDSFEYKKSPLRWRAAISTRFESAARAWFQGRLSMFQTISQRPFLKSKKLGRS